ncbi:UDP-glucose/GDP-mannose dehydrogenase family protein [Patescibacteria group bacterium]|nr:UDP-glucose/GDP-mannose dehydrogenase family protein [Patescibacteria group bacterium]
MKIIVIGTGYVGLVSSIGLAELGHTVFGVDKDHHKINTLLKGQEPFYEPDLGRLLKKNLKSHRLFFTASLAEVINKAEMIFICVGTPPKKDGSADLTYVKQVAQDINKYAKTGKVVITKSTVPVGTGQMIEDILNQKNGRRFFAVSCPEFLREGKAIYDFFHPDRIVVGAVKESTGYKVMNLFAKIKTHKIVTARETAELIKYASNAFLATKISFINEIANLCERVGADVEEVAKGMGYDKRIGPAFLKAGIGYGGSCFPKDVRALRQLAGGSGYNFRLLKSVIEVNSRQRKLFIEKIKRVMGSLNQKTITVLGLAFKDNTDDIRESAAIDIVKILQKAGAKVKVYDPEAMVNAKCLLHKKTVFCESPYAALEGSQAMIIATEWPIFADLSWNRVRVLMKKPVIFDGKNIVDDKKVRKLGFKYYPVGR